MLSTAQILDYIKKYELDGTTVRFASSKAMANDQTEIDNYLTALRIYNKAMTLRTHTYLPVENFFDQAKKELGLVGPTGPTPSGPTGPTPSGPTGPTPSGSTGPTPSAPTGPTPSGPTGPTPSGPTGPTPSGPTGPTPSGPTGPTPSGPTINSANDVDIQDEKVKKVVSTRLKKWQSKKNKRSFLEFILRKSKKHSEDYGKIFDNIAILRAHYTYWSMQKIKDSLTIIREDIENSTNLSKSERKKLARHYNEIQLHLNADEAVRNKLGMEPTQNQNLPGVQIVRVVPLAPTGPTPSGPTGPTPSAPTGPTPSAPTGPTPSAPTGPTPSAPTGPTPSAPTGPTPSAPTGPTPSAPTGPTPSAPTGPTPSAPTGPTPSAPTGPTPSAPTGPTPSAPTGPTPSAPTGPTPSAPTGPVNPFDAYSDYIKATPKINKSTYDNLSQQDKMRYLQMEACKAVFCSDFVSALMIMQYYKEFEPNDPDFSYGPFSR